MIVVSIRYITALVLLSGGAHCSYAVKAEPKMSNEEMFKTIVTGMGYDTKGTKGKLDANTLKAVEQYRIDHVKVTGDKIPKKDGMKTVLEYAPRCLFPKEEGEIEKRKSEKYCNDMAKNQIRNSGPNLKDKIQSSLIYTNKFLEACSAKLKLDESNFIKIMSNVIISTRTMDWGTAYTQTSLTLEIALEQEFPGKKAKTFCEFLAAIVESNREMTDLIIQERMETSLRAIKKNLQIF